MVADRGEFWAAVGLEPSQRVTCVVKEHRGRFGVDVEITEPVAGVEAFIDFVLLAEPGVQVGPESFPPIGSVIKAVTLDFMPWGELRLSARESSIQRAAQDGIN